MMDEKQRVEMVRELFRMTHVSQYTDKEIFSLGLRTRNDVSLFIRIHFFENASELGTRRGVFTKRVNLVWSRVEEPFKRAEGEGGVGVYLVERRFIRRPITYIFAHSYDEADHLMKLFFSCLFPPHVWIHTRFICFGQPHDVLQYNAKVLLGLEEEINSVTKRADNIEKELQLKKTLREVIINTQDHILENN